MNALALLLSVASATALAQQPAAQTSPPAASAAAAEFARAVGVVYDSIRMRPLVGAIVRVDSSALVAETGENGAYRIDSIPVGRHFLRVEHPFLDTLGIALRSPVEDYRAGSMRAAQLAVPSEGSFLQIVCTAAWRNRGPAALIGRVREADSGLPAVGAKVSLVWYEVEISTRVARVPRVREATVGADGTYRICGLPEEVDGKVQVIRGPLTSGEISVTFGSSLLYLRSMGLASAIAQAPSDSGAPVSVALGTATLRGRVTDNVGRPLPNARVQLDGTARAATSRANGEFVLDSLPAGTQNVTVRLLGYAPVEEAVDLVSATPTNVTLKMAEFVPVLEQVRVTAQRDRGLDRVGFTRRKRGIGTFFEEKDINKNALQFSDVMRIAPGVRVTPVPGAGGRQAITDARNPNGCVMIWVDGTVWQQMEPGDVDDFVKPHELAALEVYSATNTPAEFTRGTSSCMTIVAWTVRRVDRSR